MSNVTFQEIELADKVETFAIIAHADGSFTSMLKSTYDAQLEEQANDQSL